MTELHEGDLLESRYRIGATIARGGMSTVYHCVDTRLDREVAAKVMDPSLVEDPAFRTRFEREARAVAKLNHPCLVNVFDQGVDGDHVFLVMELVPGGTLRELLRERGPMPPHAALAVMSPVLTALALAHDHGMVHRDIKPDNVLIRDDHQVKLADFGLVRAVAQANPTQTGPVIGTAAYLAPEQVQGHRTGPQVDVYSAGVLLFELLTGTTPFHGETPTATAVMRVDHDVPAPSGAIDGVPPELDDLVLTATARDPLDRFADGGEFLAAVRRTVAALDLPEFDVPAPEDSAVRRALEGSDFGDRLAWDDDAMATRTVGGVPEADPVHRPGPAPAPVYDDSLPPSQERARRNYGDLPGPAETRIQPSPGFHGPAVPPPDGAVPDHAAASPVGAGAPAPAAPAPAPAARARRPLTNRSPVGTVVWTVLLVLVVVAVAVGAWWTTSGRFGEIPQVVGMDATQARASVEAAGFTSAVEERYGNDAPEQAVIGTDPPFGQRVPRGSRVAVLVSLGRPTVPTPGAGDTLSAYQSRLRDRTLQWTVADEVYSDSVPRGVVATVSPSAGTVVPTGSTVTVHVSKGPRPVTVPDVRGRDEAAARAALTAAGLQVGEVRRVFDADVDGGDAVATVPTAGGSAPSGSRVTLELSNAVTVPDVTGLGGDDARRRLSDAGLSAKDGGTTAETTEDAGDVARQDPAPGTRVDPAGGATVTLTRSSSVRVPLVIGLTADAARSRLEAAGLRVVVEGRRNGFVVTQSPGPVGRAAEGDTVTLHTL
ncbi:PASTA domain-containing protein [Corynebacterium bovis]|uniref:PASTA domain-containing protein n=1 Tax=Corynebacterium bovis TaxID=36808 RepID=UPI000F64E879|nr:PASTA domain-containing protein [Corynebacterium bovis]RRO82001.1 serine/threonine protein kinase [Corynebacterium bovis]